MFLVHMDHHQSGLGANCSTMSVEASAFQIQSVRTGQGQPNDTMTVVFFDNNGRPVNCYTGVMAVEESKVVIAQ